MLGVGAPEAPEPPARVERCASNPANANKLFELCQVAFSGEREVRKCLEWTNLALWFARVGRVPRIFGSGLVARGAACAANNPWRMVESVAGGARVSGAVVRASQCQCRQRLIMQAVASASQRDGKQSHRQGSLPGGSGGSANSGGALYAAGTVLWQWNNSWRAARGFVLALTALD